MNSVRLILAVFAAALPLSAATLSPDAAIRQALAGNRDLAAARLRIEEARGRWQHAGRLASPELELSVVPSIAGTESGVSAGVTQKFPVTSRLRLEKAVSRGQLAEAEAEVLDAERRLAREVETRVVRWAALAALRELRERQQTNSRELAAFARTNSLKGEGPVTDAFQLELEADQLTLQSRQSAAAQMSLTEELRLLLGLPETETLAFADVLPEPALPPETKLQPDARPDYRLAQARVQTAARAVELARTHRWEDIGFGVFGEARRRDDAPVGMINENLVGFRLTMPLPFGSGRSGVIHEATAAAARAEREAEALARRIQAEVAAARREMETAAQRVSEITDALLPKARELEALLSRLHSQGQSPQSEALRARAQRHALEAERIDALRDFHLARVHYQTGLGNLPVSDAATATDHSR